MGDTSQFSYNRTHGLTPGESQILDEAHRFFKLPLGAGEGKIAGVLILPDGQRFALVSGKHGGPHGGTQAGFVPRGPGNGVNRFNVTHIEGHTAAVLYRVAFESLGREKVGEAALLLPKPPCGACDPNIPQMLPPGTRLFVVDPHSTTVYRSSTGATLKGQTFPRSTSQTPASAASPVYLNVPTANSPLRRVGGNQGAVALLGQKMTSVLTNLAYAAISEEIVKRKKRLEEQIANIRSSGQGVLIITRIKRDATGDVHGAKPTLLGVHIQAGMTHQGALERWLDPRYNLMELASPPWVIDESYEWISPLYPEAREAREFPQPSAPPATNSPATSPPKLNVEPLR